MHNNTSQEKNELFEDFEELEHNDLDDIVLENMDRKERIKRYIIIAIAIITLAVTVISIVKMVSSSSSAPQEPLSEEIPITQEEEIQFNEPLPIQESDKETEQKESEVDQLIKEIVTPKKETVITPALPKEPIRKKETKPTKKTAHTSKKIQSQKRQTIKKQSASFNTSMQKQETKKSSLQKGQFYIQAGAFFKYSPSKKFLKKITKAHFHYTIVTTTKNGSKVQKVLIGPYPSRKEAEKALQKVRATIAKGAFITKATQ